MDIDRIHQMRIYFFKNFSEAKKYHNTKWENHSKVSLELIRQLIDLKSRLKTNHYDSLLSQESLSDIDKQNAIFIDFLQKRGDLVQKLQVSIKSQYFNKIHLFEEIQNNKANLMNNFFQYPSILRDIKLEIEETNTKIINSLSFQS